MIRKTVWFVVIASLLWFGTAFGRGQDTKQPEPVIKVVRVQHVDAEELAKVLAPFQAGHGSAVANRVLKTLTISGSPEIVAAMEKVVSQLDVESSRPQPSPEVTREINRNFEITAYVIIASDAATAPQAMPAVLEPVLKQLRSTFSYKSYQLLDTVVLRGMQNRSATIDGVISLQGNPAKGIDYRFMCTPSYLRHDEGGDILRLDSVSFYLQFPVPHLTSEAVSSPPMQMRGFDTSLDLHLGQMTVVGKSNFEADNNSLITVLTARIVN